MLDRIIADTRSRLPELQARRATLEAQAADAPERRDFAAALSGPGLAVIAEFKRASPSRGALNLEMLPAEQAAAYEAGGAAALSVLTEPDYFQAQPDDLAAARSAVSIPVIRKDFTLDPIHIVQARAMGADAILLIVAALSSGELVRLLGAADDVGIDALVEVHSIEEAKVAMGSGARVVGVNNRDLTTFDVDLATSEAIAPLIANASVKVGESGIHGPADAARMREAGFDALLVGEHLVKSADPAAAIAALASA